MADWIFQNKKHAQRIIVRDIDSAMQLMQLIERTEKDSWEIQILAEAEPPQSSAVPPRAPEPQAAAAPSNVARFENRRNFERYDLAYRILIIRGQVSYRSYTDNISLGGMLLKNTVPDKLLGEVCNIYIGHPNRRENIELTARVIGKGEASRRVAFTEVDDDSKTLLEKWMRTSREDENATKSA